MIIDHPIPLTLCPNLYCDVIFCTQIKSGRRHNLSNHNKKMSTAGPYLGFKWSPAVCNCEALIPGGMEYLPRKKKLYLTVENKIFNIFFNFNFQLAKINFVFNLFANVIF